MTLKISVLFLIKSHNKALQHTSRCYASFMALRYNATKVAQLFGQLNLALYLKCVFLKVIRHNGLYR